MSLPESPIIACGPRVALRLLADGDREALAAWLPQAAAAAQGRKTPSPQDEASARQLLAASGCPLLAVAPRSGGAPLGVIAYRPGEPDEGWAAIAFFAMAPAQRGRGLGGEALLAFEEAAARQGWGRRFCAPVHPENGLSVYFWLRLGYRPARPSDFPPYAKPGAPLWMVRLNL